MPLRTFLFTMAAASLATGAAHAQSITPVSISHHAEAFARLDWTSPITPDSIDTDSVSSTALGQISVEAHPSNQGITSVDARGFGGSAVLLQGDTYRLVASGGFFGHSNLAALADASFACGAAMVFDIDRSVEVLLECSFINNLTPFGEGELSTSLIGPGGASIFSFARAIDEPGVLEFTESILLQPGQYTLSVTGFGEAVLPSGLSNFVSAPGAIIDIGIVPSPGGLMALGLALGVPHRRRRQA
jgi:hypothetical protein